MKSLSLFRSFIVLAFTAPFFLTGCVTGNNKMLAEYEVQLEIAVMHLNREQAFLAERGHKIMFDGDVLTFLLQVGFDKYLGARPLRKAMEKHIRYPLAHHLVTHDHEFLSGTLKVHAAKTGLTFST